MRTKDVGRDNRGEVAAKLILVSTIMLHTSLGVNNTWFESKNTLILTGCIRRSYACHEHNQSWIHEEDHYEPWFHQ
jgi:hypothetical protein